MKIRNRTLALTIAMASLTVAQGIQAGTKLKDDKWKEFTPDAATQDLNVRPDSFYNLGMGLRGWTHHSNWGFVKLKKGNTVTITATTTVTDMHPGIAVWLVPQGRGITDKLWNYDHFYKQWGDIYMKDLKDADNGDAPIPGTMKWTFITNGFDRDGMGDSLPADYDQSGVNRVLDGTVGSVSVTFTAPAKGYYKFVVGGINPGASLIDTTSGKPKEELEKVTVTVDFPD